MQRNDFKHFLSMLTNFIFLLIKKNQKILVLNIFKLFGYLPLWLKLSEKNTHDITQSKPEHWQTCYILRQSNG